MIQQYEGVLLELYRVALEEVGIEFPVVLVLFRDISNVRQMNLVGLVDQIELEQQQDSILREQSAYLEFMMMMISLVGFDEKNEVSFFILGRKS